MTTTTAPTVDRIRQILTEAAGPAGMAYDYEADALTYEGAQLVPEAVHAGWATITPDTNEGNITDPEVATVFGAIMSGDLWTTPTKLESATAAEFPTTLTVAELAEELAVTPADVIAIAEQVAAMDGDDRVWTVGDGRGEPIEVAGSLRSPGIGLTAHAVDCVRAEIAARAEVE